MERFFIFYFKAKKFKKPISPFGKGGVNASERSIHGDLKNFL